MRTGVAPQAPRAGWGRGHRKAADRGVELWRQAGMSHDAGRQMHGDGQVGRAGHEDQTIHQPLNPAGRHPLRSARHDGQTGRPADLRPSTSDAMQAGRRATSLPSSPAPDIGHPWLRRRTWCGQVRDIYRGNPAGSNLT